MRLQVRYPGSPPHEVELLGRVSIVGRDPTCDLVVHDVKCSRRHAVLETGPDGVTIRDSGSANGIFVNGQRVERAVLRSGDVVSLGEVQISLIPEGNPSAEATLMTPVTGGFATPPAPPSSAPPLTPPMALPRPAVMAPPGPPSGPPAPAAPPPPPFAPPAPTSEARREPTDVQRPRGSYSLSGSTESGRIRAEQLEREMEAERRSAAGRPLTVTVLAVLWMASVVVYLLSGIGAVAGTGGLIGWIAAAFCGLMALVSAAMALGLWTVKPWARIAQLVLAGLGILTCSFTLPSIAILVYVLRPAVKARFATGAGPGDPKEGLFTGLILGTVALGVLVAGGLWAVAALGLAGSEIP